MNCRIHSSRLLLIFLSNAEINSASFSYPLTSRYFFLPVRPFRYFTRHTALNPRRTGRILYTDRISVSNPFRLLFSAIYRSKTCLSFMFFTTRCILRSMIMYPVSPLLYPANFPISTANRPPLSSWQKTVQYLCTLCPHSLAFDGIQVIDISIHCFQ